MTHNVETWTVGELVAKAGKSQNKVNANPIGQRPPISEGWGKSQGIVESVQNEISIGAITLRYIKKNEELQKVYPRVDYTVIDGGHRVRSLLDFTNNVFMVNGRFYSDLSDAEQNAFNETKLIIIIYDNIDDSKATEIFRALNTVTPVNKMEMIMSNDTSIFAKEIRSRVKVYPEYGNKVHRIFETIQKSGQITPNPMNWKGEVNPRRKWDEYVAIVMTKVIGNGNVSAGIDKIGRLVEKDERVSSKNLGYVDKMLEDALKVKVKSKKEFNADTFGAFQVVWFALFEEAKDFKILDYNKFSKEFYKAHAKLTGNTPNSYDKDLRQLPTTTNKKQLQIVKEFARKAGKQYSSQQQQEAVAELYLKEMDIDDIILKRDERRTITKDKKFEMLSEQEFLCAIDGLPLDIDDAIFGHDTAWSKGGRIEDGAIVRKKHNVDMGTMTIAKYKAWLEFDIAYDEMTV